MKATFCLICFLVVLATITAYPWGGGNCQRQSDCGEDQCCVKYNAWYGNCMMRGGEGDICVPNTGYNKFYKAMCPCQEGFECKAGDKGIYPHMEFIRRPICQKKPTTAAPPPSESS